MTKLEKARERIKQWRKDPLSFVDHHFKVKLDSWQEEALRSLGGDFNPRRRICFKACTGPGKSMLLALIAWHRLTCFAEKGEHPKGAAISGEGKDNLKSNFWSEMSKWQQRSEFLMQAFTWQKELIYANDHPETWFMDARSYPKDANPDVVGNALSGLHSRFPFFILDEIGRMPVVVGQKASQIFTGGQKDALIACAGNPVSTEGLLYYIAEKERDMWKLITITADPDDPKRTSRVDIAHAREQIALHGRDNSWIMSTILGLFPLTAINSLFSLDEVESALGRQLHEMSYSFVEKRIGVDVALYGDDRTVLFPRQGLASFPPTIMRTQEPAEISARLISEKMLHKSDQEFIDDTGGWGSGVISHLKMAGYNPYPVQAASKAPDPKFYNLRAYMWFGMRDWLRSGGCLPRIPEIVPELTKTEYTMKDGLLILEPKAIVKKKLGRSPDIADALAQTFAIPDMPKSMKESNYKSSKARSEYDPYSRD